MRLPLTWVAGAMALVAVVAVAGVAYIVATTGESAGREEGVTLGDVVNDPERYEGQQVRISGEWAENAYFDPAQADEVIVLGEDAGSELLVVPELGVDVPPIDEDTVVIVEGVVRVPDRAQAGLLAPGGLMEREDGGVAPVVAATRVELTELREGAIATNADQATIRQLLRDPRAWDERSLVVPGTIRRITGRGFVLTQEGASIFVSAPAAQLSGLRRGQQVRVRAELSRLSQFGADALEKAVTTDPPGDQPAPAQDLGDLPIDRGEPYLLLRAVEPAG